MGQKSSEQIFEKFVFAFSTFYLLPPDVNFELIQLVN